MVKKSINSEKSSEPDSFNYMVPFWSRAVPHEVIFGIRGENPLLLRPIDVERLYGIPVSTIYDWIHEQAETHFPAFKLAVKDESKRRLVLIPKQLLDEWIVERSTLEMVKQHL